MVESVGQVGQGAGEVIFERLGSAAIIRLNRPKALNSLTLDMVRAIRPAMADYASDPSVTSVVITGEGERGFCAGGDIRAIHDLGKRGEGEAAAQFWREEFPLNYTISHYPKPYVALMDGIVMGGGVGISAHGRHRVVTERTRLAMPETGIGYVPDVGVTWLLGRAPGETGTWMALTGLELDAADAIHAGFADHCVPCARLADLVAALADLPVGLAGDEAHAAVEGAISRFSVSAGDSRLAGERDLIDRVFAGNGGGWQARTRHVGAGVGGAGHVENGPGANGNGANGNVGAGNVGAGDGSDTVEHILFMLDGEAGEFAKMTRETIRRRSPTSLKLTLKMVRMARVSSGLVECLEREFTVGRHILRHGDFYEGVRAAIVDKDRNPKWSPPTLADIRDADLDRYFAGGDEVLFPDHRL
jgi:enoyl-CoA hydratase